MFLKLGLFLPMLIAVCLNTSPMLMDVKVPCVNQYKQQDTYNNEDYKLLAAIPEQDIYLYAMDWKEEEIKNRGVYRDILLDLKGKQRVFPCWNIDTNPAFKPELIITDMNNDGWEDLAVITTRGTGTGVFIQEVRIFEIDTYNDIYVMDPIEAIYQNVKTEIVKKNGIVTITIKVREKIFTLTAKESSLGLWYDDAGFGSRTEYDVIDNKLIAKVGVQVGLGIDCGLIVMDYEFKNKRLEVNNIEFEKLNNQSIFIYK
jgi:hypothetical protein